MGRKIGLERVYAALSYPHAKALDIVRPHLVSLENGDFYPVLLEALCEAAPACDGDIDE